MQAFFVCSVASNGRPDFRTPYATCASFLIIAPIISFAFFPFFSSRSLNSLPHSVLY
ncbi:hypothetical protein AZ036_000030, partial [Klebsiella michiganensis]